MMARMRQTKSFLSEQIRIINLLVFTMSKSKIPRSLKPIGKGHSSTDNREVISVDECRAYLRKYNLSDQEIERIRNSLVGIVESTISSYLSDFL